ncbi:GNAT family N-acetyltransferase [Arthrobacter sp. B3I4]|uniref:GNAT family N-acetyltransferase n=1 Tax=Arthrobacter sp. B3I4 TaxID=3042267 RepID=UPI00277D9BB0|nr:GNAT family N-acetyltransferase [Arthrobacter sp. B3I4]MDQ0754550.1 ribosomal protein S18 acetylase RimI-like enzyme [Arthrobacter sp. B3I4]
MDYTIRQAAPGDADALVRMHTAVHEECYGHVLPAAFFAARRASIQERTERRRPYLDSSEPRIIALDASGEIVGFADAGPGRDDDRPRDLELYSLYTLARAYGSGLGSAMLNTALGNSAAYLWVLEDNPRARAFYAKHGFRPDGERKLLPAEWSDLPEIRLVRSGARRWKPGREPS